MSTKDFLKKAGFNYGVRVYDEYGVVDVLPDITLESARTLANKINNGDSMYNECYAEVFKID